MIIGISGKLYAGKNTVARIIQKLIIEHNDNIELSIDAVMNGSQSYIDYASKWETKAFAHKVKLVGSILTGYPVERFEDQDFKKTELPKQWNVPIGMWPGDEEPMTIRRLLQRIGTNAMRNNVHSNVWVNALFADYKPQHSPPYARYTGEAIRGEDGQFYIPQGVGPKGSWGVQIATPIFEWHEPIDTTVFPNWIITDPRFPNEIDAIHERNGIIIRIERDTIDRSGSEHQHESETALDSYTFPFTIKNNGSIEDLIIATREVLRSTGLL